MLNTSEQVVIISDKRRRTYFISKIIIIKLAQIKFTVIAKINQQKDNVQLHAIKLILIVTMSHVVLNTMFMQFCEKNISQSQKYYNQLLTGGTINCVLYTLNKQFYIIIKC